MIVYVIAWHDRCLSLARSDYQQAAPLPFPRLTISLTQVSSWQLPHVACTYLTVSHVVLERRAVGLSLLGLVQVGV